MMTWQEQMVKEVNDLFGPPFLVEGMVRATMRKGDILNIRIGRRDVDFNRRGQMVGAGTNLCSMEESKGVSSHASSP